MGLFCSRDRNSNSDTFGVVLVTIPNPAVDTVAGSQVCLDCVVQQRSGVQVYVDRVTCAVATGWKMSSAAEVYPVTNLDQLHFFGTAGDVIQIKWRN